jgi:hypothetical protein
VSRPKIGVFADCTDLSMPILELADALEERGFEGLFLNEHAHLPVGTPRSQHPAGGLTPIATAASGCRSGARPNLPNFHDHSY